MKRTLTLLIGAGCLLAANEEIPRKIELTKTEHADLPAGGTVRIKNSTGELTIEGWDQPGVEITTTKSTKLPYPATGAEHDKAAHMLDEVKVSATTVSAATKGGELVITTDFPRHRRFLLRPSVGERDFDLDYLIKVPRDAKLIVDHDSGEVHIDDVTGDVHATAIQGLVTLHLPQASQYSIDAKSKMGEVISDFPGATKREHFGHAFTQSAQVPHSLYMRIGFGDIIILKTKQPPAL
jgi:hypothetical protein